jgi:NAD(P)-dependent dehydrogenase (short-subunit alcohol dehydrogenase family)
MPATDFAGRTFFITGATSGIGRATAAALAARDATVIIGARSEDKARQFIDELHRRYPRADLSVVTIDLASLASVRRAADVVLASGRPLDVLINNAGRAGRGGTTADGFEITIGTNHVGPFLLTELLLPALRDATQGRIVNVASRAHMGVKRLDWGAIARPPGIKGGISAYGVSKLMNVLHAKELARRLADTRITTYSLHPGVVASDIWRELPRPVQWVMMRFMISNEEGARTSLYCATAAELSTSSGRYYDKCREAQPSRLAMDESLARELYVRSDAAIRAATPNH